MNQDQKDLPEQITPSSPNFQTELAEKIAAIAPEVITDGKLDVIKLRELVNGDAETAPEKFGLFWPGKQRAQAIAQTPTSATLAPVPEESEDWDTTKNIFIEGDNLEVLKVLQNSYRRKVKMIYIDPPYNTGNEFIYSDNFQEGLATYLNYTDQRNKNGERTEIKRETGGRKHSNWLSMMYPRLQLARSLLTDDGVTFISIDDNEVEKLKIICNEVFGEENFVAQIPWRKRTAKSDVPFGVSQDFEWIIAYARTSKFLAGEAVERKYYTTDDYPSDRWRLADLTSQRSADERPNSAFNLINPKNGDEYVFNPNRTWALTKDTFGEYYTKGKIVFPGDYDFLNIKIPAYRVFESEDRAKAMIKYGHELTQKAVSTLLPKEVGMSETGNKDIVELFNGKVFSFPKPVSLMAHLLQTIGDKDAIVLDLFSGSGTIAQAIDLMNASDAGNRRFVLIQLPEPTDAKSEAFKAGYMTIADIAKERIRRAGKKIREDYADKIAARPSPLDTGFRVYKLSESNFVQWDEERAKDDIVQAVLNFAENKKSNAAPEGLLTEILLQTRLPLSAQIERHDLPSGGWVYVVDSGNLIAYVAEDPITEAQASEIADMAPAKLVVLDSAFNGNDALKINIANICRDKGIKDFRTI